MSDDDRRRPSGPRTLRTALILVAAAVLGLTYVEAALLVAAGGPTVVLLMFPATGLVYIAVGSLAWIRRPSHRMGPLLCAGGLVWLAAGLNNTTLPALVAVGQIVATVPLAVVLHALLAFPSGRLDRGLPRTLVVAGYATTVLLQAPIYLFGPEPGTARPLLVADRPDLAALGHGVQASVAAVIIAITTVLLVRRLVSGGRARRRVLVPLYGFGVFAIVGVTASANLLELVVVPDPLVVPVLQILVLAGVPVAFVAAVLRGGFARTAELAELGAWLGTRGSEHDDLRDAIARALGDPGADLVYRVEPGDGGPAYWVDDAGASADPTGRPGHRLAPVLLDGRRIAAIRYDAELIHDHDEVVAVGRVAAIAIDRRRLTAQLLAGQEELRESRARLVQAGDRERRRLAQDLHDRLQSRLVLLGMQTGGLVARDGDRDPALRSLLHGLDEAISELRALVQGVMPALLIERGLSVALESLVDRCPLPTALVVVAGADAPLPAAVESTAYHVVSEALANAVKHSGAGRIEVRVDRHPTVLRLHITDDGVGGAAVGSGLGLPGMADRVAALRGTLAIDSAPGAGTRLTVEMPCGS